MYIKSQFSHDVAKYKTPNAKSTEMLTNFSTWFSENIYFKLGYIMSEVYSIVYNW